MISVIIKIKLIIILKKTFITLKKKSETKLNDINIINNIKEEKSNNDNNFSGNDNL